MPQYKISNTTADRIEKFVKKKFDSSRTWYRKAGQIPYWAISFDEVMDILLAEAGY